ncbi:MAG: hypothetical protein EBZ77_07020 [Chitinophagia bacterium]|nr:hypothetical protein [Chitinophagia bacterium]
MKELLTALAGYNAWANKAMINKMLAVTPELLDRPLTSSFASIRTTVYHCWSAEDIWLQRLQQVAEPIWAEGIFEGSFSDACANWAVISEGLVHYVANHSETELQQPVLYNDLKGNAFHTPASEILLHVFNHATYHRGQLVTLLRTVGETEIPRTDFIVYSRTVLAPRA